MNNKSYCLIAGLIFLLLVPVTVVSADDLVYRPRLAINGGHPGFSAHLLQLAQIENRFEEAEPTIAERFQETLERRMLSAMAKAITDRIFGDDEEVAQMSDFEVGGIEVSLEDRLDSLMVNIIDENGATSIEIPY